MKRHPEGTKRKDMKIIKTKPISWLEREFLADGKIGDEAVIITFDKGREGIWGKDIHGLSEKESTGGITVQFGKDASSYDPNETYLIPFDELVKEVCKFRRGSGED